MEQIIITKPDGSKMPIANRRTATDIKTATQTMELLGVDVVNINVESPFKQEYGIGDKITVFGRVYKLNRLPKMRKTGVHHFAYDLEFEGIQYDLARATYDLTIDTTNNQLQDVQSNALNGDLKRFADVLISNANRVMPGVWKIGTYPSETKTKNLTFGETDNCLSVLQRICEEFDTEFEIEQKADGTNIIHFRKSGQIFPFKFEYGKGKGIYVLDRQNVSSANIITRLKVYGSTRNITHKYRANRLCLPGKTKGQSFIEKPEVVQKYGIWEATKYFDDIAPSRTGKVTSIASDSVLKFIDNTMFDLNEKEQDGKTTKYLLPGVSAKIRFNTGNLAGYEFEVHSYDHASKTFTIKQFQDERSEKFPSEKTPAFQFKVGDEYKLVDIALPATFENAAESELATEGDKFYNQNSQPKVQYGLEIHDSFLQRFVADGTTVNIFSPGDYIQVKDDDIDVDKSIRIRGFTRNLKKEYQYSLTISDTVTSSLTARVISELNEISNIVSINQLKDPIRARANWRSSRELFDMVFDADGDYYTDKIKPESIDTIALSVGAKSMQFALTNTIFEANYTGNKNLVKIKGGVLTHYTIDENKAVSWVLTDSTVTLNNDSTPYYIYAKCERGGNAGSILLSTEQIKVNQDANHHHFFIGVINSVDPELNARSISLAYGFTMINGRFIKTGRIESSGGSGSYFDLDENKFHIGDATTGLSWNVDGTRRLVLKGTMVQSESGIVQPIGVFRGEYNNSVRYFPGDEVAYKVDGITSMYRQKHNSSTIGQSPTSSAYWDVVAQGSKGIDGQKGADGIQYYNWIKYADTPTSGMSDNPDGKKYLGIAVNKTTPVESNNYSDYQWQLTKGEPGDGGVGGSDSAATEYYEYRYAKNGSTTVPPALDVNAQNPSGWSKTMPAIGNLEYLWFTMSKKSTLSDKHKVHVPIEQNSVQDISGNGYNGVLADGATIVSDGTRRVVDASGKGVFTIPYDMPFGSSFTISTWIKVNQGRVKWLLSGESGLDYVEEYIEISANTWAHFAFRFNAKSVTVFKNGEQVSAGGLNEKIIGFSLADDYLHGSNVYFDDVRIIDGALSVEDINKIKAGDSDKLVQTWSAPVRINPYDGKDGKSPALVYRGVYDVGKTYYGNSNRVDAVKYNGLFYVTRIDAGEFTDSGINRPDKLIKWNTFGAQFESVATNLLLAEMANVGGFIFKNNKLISQKGLLNGQDSQNFEHPNFSPNIVLDGVLGLLKANSADIMGRFESNRDGNKIIIDPNKREIEMVASGERVVCRISFEQSGQLIYPKIQMFEYEGDTITRSGYISSDGVSTLSSKYKQDGNFNCGVINLVDRNYPNKSFNVATDNSRPTLTVRMSGLPTSTIGLNSGELYRNGNQIYIVP